MNHTAPQSILLVCKGKSTAATETAEHIRTWLTARGVSVRTISTMEDRAKIRAAAKGQDAALVLGGDGAMLGVARALIGLDVPLLGINFGRVGFLTEIPAQAWEPMLQALLNGEFFLQKHLALNWRLTSTLSAERNGWVVNDVVIARGTAARAISLDLSVDDIHLSSLRCDGVIVSAPLGATAYAASAKGPLAFPSLECQLVTPISPFAGAFPPLVLPAASRINLSHNEPEQDVRLNLDGQDVLAIQPGDCLEIYGVPNMVHLLVHDPKWYLRRLVERGFILTGPGLYA